MAYRRLCAYMHTVCMHKLLEPNAPLGEGMGALQW